MAVCGFCRSTLVRDGDALRRIGQSAELFDDHSPLQIGVQGRYQGAAFTLVGRLQMRYAGGTWNEWHALFDGDANSGVGTRSGWLSEDNAGHVFSFDMPAGQLPAGGLPDPAALQAGQSLTLDGRFWSVASVTAVRVNAAQGELPVKPQMERGWVVADLRNTQGEVATLDGSAVPPRWSVGHSVALSELALSGLKDESAKDLKGRAIECPSCGAALEPKLETTQSIVCGQCRAVVDVSKGVGADLGFYRQDNGLEPLLPLGRVGSIALGPDKPASWQVVGYVERCEIAAADGDDQESWREYLLYHRTNGFAFIVDANDGWSWTRPITGVPANLRGQTVSYEGDSYRKLYDYAGKITYVLGEFYWHLEREQRTENTDYIGTGSSARKKRLNRERTGDEIVWSAGETLEAADVMRAFKIDQAQARSFARDATPGGMDAQKVVRFALWVVLILIIVAWLARCDDDCADTRNAFGENSNEYRNCRAARSSSGGHYGSSYGSSYGGYSSGSGGHK